MGGLLFELQHRCGNLAKRVVGPLVVDAQHLTENRLPAEARAFYKKSAA